MKKSVGICVLGLLVVVCTFFFFTNFKTVHTLNSVVVHTLNKVETEKKIMEVLDNSYKIQVRYPYTSYVVLNQEIEDKIGKQVSSFLGIVDDLLGLENQHYTLEITYEAYSYLDYISYVFTIFVDTMGAHPNTYIETVSYSKKTNQIITIADLEKEYPQILSGLSEEVRKVLLNSGKFDDSEVKDMLIDGTKPNLENFRNFAFTDQGLLILLERYQVAPYSFGSFEVLISYSKLGMG